VKGTLKDDYTSLVRYLLGELLEDEQERVEERYMLDEAFSQLREEVELDLVDAYVAGTLTAFQRKHLEDNYLITPDRKRAAQAAWLCRAYRRHIVLEAKQPAWSWWKRIHRWLFAGGRLAPVLVAAAALAAVGVGESWLILKRNEEKRLSVNPKKLTKPEAAVEKQPDAAPMEPAGPPPVATPPLAAVVSPPKNSVKSEFIPGATRPAQPEVSHAPKPEPIAAPVVEPPPPVVPSTSPPALLPEVPKPKPAPASATLPAGTEVAIRTRDPIDSRRATPAREFAATLDSPLVVNGVAVAPQGANATLRIVGAGQGGKQKRNASLSLRLTAITVNGQSVAVETGDVASATSSTVGRTATAGDGAATLVFRGREVMIPSETRLTFNLTRPVAIRP
jgi:hypothetical protein